MTLPAGIIQGTLNPSWERGRILPVGKARVGHKKDIPRGVVGSRSNRGAFGYGGRVWCLSFKLYFLKEEFLR